MSFVYLHPEFLEEQAHNSNSNPNQSTTAGNPSGQDRQRAFVPMPNAYLPFPPTFDLTSNGLKTITGNLRWDKGHNRATTTKSIKAPNYRFLQTMEGILKMIQIVRVLSIFIRIMHELCHEPKHYKLDLFGFL